MHVPVGFGVAELARRLGWRSPGLIGASWAAAGVLLFVGRARAGMPDRRGRHPAIVRLVDIPYFIHWCACLWTLIPSVVATLVAPVGRSRPRHACRTCRRPCTWSRTSRASRSAAYGILVRRRWYRVAERDVRVPGLDPRFEGLRIAQLSDLHIGTLTPRSWGLALVALRQRPRARPCGGHRRHGHERHRLLRGRRRRRRRAARQGRGLRLHGQPRLLRRRGRAPRVDAPRSRGRRPAKRGRRHRARRRQALARRDRRHVDPARRHRDARCAIGLRESPRCCWRTTRTASTRRPTRGPTSSSAVTRTAVRSAFRSSTASRTSRRFGYRYNVGLYRRGQSVLYVHPGLGTTGPPMRLGVPPEVAILTLRAA